MDARNNVFDRHARSERPGECPFCHHPPDLPMPVALAMSTLRDLARRLATRPWPGELVLAAVGVYARAGALLVEKNQRYGDSAGRPVRIFSRTDDLEQLRVRLDDKLSRIARGAGEMAEDEDTVFDLLGYLGLYLGRRATITQAGKGG